MRRLALLGTVGILLVLGFGSAYVLAAVLEGKQSVHVGLCHSGNGTNFTPISPADAGALDGHVKNHDDDIIPPFVIVENGTTTTFPGRNMNSIYGDGFTGAQVLANGCEIPTGEQPAVTETETIATTTTVPVTVTTPETTVTLPGGTTTEVITATVTVPGETATAPGTTTVVTVPADVTTTVTLPSRTTTLPAVTTTSAGQTIERPPETVTLPGTTATLTGAATTAVVTVTGPNQVVRQGLVARKRVRFAVTTPRRVVAVAGRVHRLRAKARVLGKRVVVVVVRSKGCPAGSALFHGRCSAVVRGKG